MNTEPVLFRDLGRMAYAEAWDYQESLLRENVQVKTRIRSGETGSENPSTTNYLLFVEHPPVYTLGKSGQEENVLLNQSEMNARGIRFFRTNRGGDITFHGPEPVSYTHLTL